MANIFLMSDQHFGHKNILNFKRRDGITPLRLFDSSEEMDEHMVDCHNKVVKPNDKIYMLGDLAMNKKFLPILDRLNGEKILIKGNHDQDSLAVYAKYFKDVRASHQLAGHILTHIPIHSNSLSRWKKNLHGHLHADVVGDLDTDGIWQPDHRYVCLSVEHTNYFPIALEDIDTFANEQHDKAILSTKTVV
jgi:calcineurin-like phosphoesterase family protein